MNNFNKPGLSTSIIEVLNQLGYQKPTPIEKNAIPMLLRKGASDFIGIEMEGRSIRVNLDDNGIKCQKRSDFKERIKRKRGMPKRDFRQLKKGYKSYRDK